MLIFWRIRFFDRGTRTFNDRDLYLDTQELDAATRTAIEYIAESNDQRIQRKIGDFRSQFKEGDWITLAKSIENTDVPRWVGSFDYFEDENRNPISERELGPLLTGNPKAMMIPHGAQQHDIDLMLAQPEPIPLENVSLSEKDIRTLAYFIRDLKELDESAFRKDGRGIIKSVGTIPSPQLCDPMLETGVTDDEIRSAVIIFRRFFMKGEPANFNKAVDVYISALKGHPYAKWVDGVRNEFNSTLNAPPDLLPFSQGLQITFTTRDLIEVFLYTQYAHQPVSKRETQYADCLEQVKGRKNFLTWLFLTEVWVCSLKIISAGRTIAALVQQVLPSS